MTKLSRADLQIEDSTVLLQDNTSSDILPSEHRQANINIHDSFLSLVDDNIDIDLDTSLKYLSDPSGAWDSSPTHDLKLTPKVYVDDFVTSSLSGYAKLDASNTPFTGAITIKDNVANEMNSTNGYWKFSHLRGIGSLNPSSGLYVGNGNTDYVNMSGVIYLSLNGGSVIANGTVQNNYFRGNVSSGDMRLQMLMEDSATGGMLITGRHTDGITKYIYISTRDSDPYNAYFKKAMIEVDSSPTIAGSIRDNTTTNKHQGYDGTTWNDLY